MSENRVKFKFLALSLFLLISGGMLFFWGFTQTPSNPTIPTELPKKVIDEVKGEDAMVSRVVDGDTIVLSSGEKVRYIGIDTPETVDPRRPVDCFGKEASDENKKLIEGKNVILAKDVSDKDQFGRLLRFVYLKQDDGSLIFVNDYLVRSGFAKASTYPPDVKFATQFVSAEKEARENQRGLWKMCL